MTEPSIITELPVDTGPLVRPAWADPRYMLATSKWASRTLTDAGPVTVRAARADPSRWAIGFIAGTVTPGTTRVAPFAEVSGFGFPFELAQQALWFSVFIYGPMVSDEWLVSLAAGDTLRVIEVTTQ